MEKLHELHRPTLPTAYANIVLEIAKDQGFDAQQVLNNGALDPDLIEENPDYITPWEYVMLHISVAQLTGDQSIGMQLGLRMRPTAHGFLGYAILSCNNLREAMQLGLRFMRIRQQQIAVEYRRDGDNDIVTFRERQDFGPVRHFLLEGMLIGVARSAQYLLNSGELDLEMWLDYPEPHYFDRFRSQLPNLKFNQSETRLILRSEDLDHPLRMADPIGSAQAIKQCEQELARLADSPELLREVRLILESQLEEPPGLDEVANNLCMSPRSLKRKLASHNSSFQQLLHEVRFERAKQLLAEGDHNLQQIGLQLGYHEPASFTRAFKKWSGVTPKQWRP